MVTSDYYITKKSDIFFFYQIIAHTKAKRILDLGMFFERVGAVSRQIGDAELPEGMVVDGFCTDAEGVLPVYATIYDNIYYQKLLQVTSDKSYDLSCHIRLSGSRRGSDNIYYQKLLQVTSDKSYDLSCHIRLSGSRSGSDNIYLLEDLDAAKPTNERTLTGNKRQLNAYNSINRSYDMVMLLRGAGIPDKSGIHSAIRKARERTKYMALDDESFRLYDKSIVGYRTFQEITVEDEKYLLLEF